MLISHIIACSGIFELNVFIFKKRLSLFLFIIDCSHTCATTTNYVMTIIVQYVIFSACCISASVGKMFTNLSLATVVVHCTYTLFNVWGRVVKLCLSITVAGIDWDPRVSGLTIGSCISHSWTVGWARLPNSFTKNLQHCLMCKMLHKQPEVVKLWLRTLSTSPMQMCEFTASCQSMQHLDIITNEFCMQILLNIIFLIWNEAHARTKTLQRTSSLISKLLYVGLFPYLFATMEKKINWTRTKYIIWKHWLLTWLSNKVGFGKIKSCKRVQIKYECADTACSSQRLTEYRVSFCLWCVCVEWF